jgi:catechol 2,3-dioxygenase-like lactoylglutathione lyase family enzyme
VNRIADCVADGIRPKSSHQAAASKVKVIKKLPPPTPHRCEGRLFPPEQSEATKMSLQLANIWMILNVGGGPTPDKPTVTLSVPDPNHINSFMNFRVADIQACYELWKSRGAEFITEPIPKYGETRCYIRDPDGYIIEVGQSTDLKYG